ncbi:MAG: hypothetical protein LBS86_06475 [Treponema sp.]|jgi:hypothetical protein|nr:hypothetical protein [Treponema sp.]
MYIAIMLSAISLLGCVFFFFYFKAYITRRTGDALLAEYREEVKQLIAELDAATDRDERLVTERIKTLKTLIEKVDKRLSVLMGEEERRRVHAETYAELGRKRPLVTDAASNGSTVMAKAPSEPEAREPAGPRIVVAEQQLEPAPLPLVEQVMELYKAGLSVDLIASKLKVSVSEVELAAALFSF